VINLQQTLRLLAEHEVDFIIIGGVAISAHGSSYLTFDLDICYLRTKDNLRRLVAALSPYHPRLRDMPEGLPFIWDESTLRQGTNFTLSTDLGDIDLLGEVKGVGTYDDALSSSIVVHLFGNDMRILSLKALIESKRAAGRTKDLLVLPELEAMLALDETSEE
jgi:predicted nucleotidyltransferase